MEENYIKIPNWIRKLEKLTYGQKIFYGVLLSFSNQEGYCYASNQYLADEMGTSKDVIIRWLSVLKKNNLIKIEIERDDKKEIISRKIFILGYVKEESEEIDNEKELSENFDLIWKEYPRKEGKNSAFKHYKAWKKGKKYSGKTIKLTNKQMWYAVQKYKEVIEKNKIEPKYIKMGSTFFNEAIYEYVEDVQN